MRKRRGLPRSMLSAHSAAPSAPPPSPAAGWIKSSSKESPDRIRWLATLFRPTPPAMHKLFWPVSFCSCRAMESKTSSVTCWMLAAMSA